MKTVGVTVLKILGLVIVFFVMSAVLGTLLPLSFDAVAKLAPEERPVFMPLFVLTVVINMSVLMFLLTTLRYTGWKLFCAVFAAFYGLLVLVNETEMIWYHEAFQLLTYADIWKTLVTGLCAYAAVTIVGMFLTNGFRKTELERHIHLDSGRFGWKLVLFPLLYAPFYFFCGFIAWSFPATREFYANWAATTDSNWSLLLFNVFRGALWLLFSIPLLLGYTSRKQAFWLMPVMLVVATAVAFVVPNPIIPPAVRFAHITELTLSMTVVGMFMVMLFLRDKRATSRQ